LPCFFKEGALVGVPDDFPHGKPGEFVHPFMMLFLHMILTLYPPFSGGFPVLDLAGIK